MANPLKSMQRTREEYRSMDRLDRRRFWSDSILNNALYILMFVFVVYTAIKNKNFLAPGSIVNILSLVAASLPMALGIAGCIVLTGTDLSGGRVVGLTAAVAGALLQDRTISRKLFSNLPAITPGWILLTILIVVAIGALIGMVNGFFVAKFSLHPFIVTLATQLITYGLILIFFMLNGNNGQPVSGLSQEYKSVVSAPMIQFTTGSGAKISIPWYVLYAVIFVALMWFIWNKTTFGKNLFAVGGNPEAASVSGISVFWVTVGAFVLAGILYGFGSWLECIRMVGSGSAAYGQGWEMDAIAACVVGGISFTGGIGKISGVVVGVFIFTALTYSLTVLGIDTNLQFVFSGIIILVAVTLDCLKYVQKK